MTYDTIEEKLAALAECGLKLKEPFGVPDLVASWGREALDEPGFDLALVCLGMTEEAPPWRPHCDNLWHFDTECIDGPGSYVRIAERMAQITQGSLPLTDIGDHVDIEGRQAWLRFNCSGATVQVPCTVEDDWVDAAVFGCFVDMLARCDPVKVFVYYDLGGQDCIIGCVTNDEYQRLGQLTPQVRPLT